MPPDAIPEPWLSFLKELDDAVDMPARLDCMGGFVVTMLYGLNRPTADIDVLEIAPAAVAAEFRRLGSMGGALHRKYGIYLDHVELLMCQRSTKVALRRCSPAVSSACA